jgi:two-component system phosphate regulon sensor histidine kinase PhoR
MKNVTQNGISFLIALSVLASLLLLLIFLHTSEYFVFDLKSVILVPLIAFLATYFFTYYFVGEFIYRKIKIIYQVIGNLKTDNPVKIEKNQGNLIEEVERQVIEFSVKKSAEIEELKKLEQYRRDFLGNVSHELKTPIFNVQGYVETLIDGGIEDKSINKLYLEKASRNLDRLSSIVEDLLQISQYESGELKIEEEKFDILKLTKEVFDSFAFQAEQKEINLKFKETADNTFFVMADKTRIAQVLNNLVSNAIKYGSPQGNVSVGFFREQNKILTEITDDGMGISKEHLPRLFERFYRVDKNRSRESGGTGLAFR